MRAVVIRFPFPSEEALSMSDTSNRLNLQVTPPEESTVYQEPSDLVHAKVFLGALARESFHFLRRHYRRFLLLAILTALPLVGVFSHLLGGGKIISLPSLALFLLLDWIGLGWALHAARGKAGFGRNLLFPSWKTVPKLFLLTLGVFWVLWGIRYVLHDGLMRIGLSHVAAWWFTTLLVLLFFQMKLALSWHFILDRDFGPVRALKSSWLFTRSNGLALLICGFCFTAAILAFSFLIFEIFFLVCSFPLARKLFESLFWGWGREFAIPFYMILCVLFHPFVSAFSALFYLTATGQRHPGAWPRENA